MAVTTTIGVRLPAELHKFLKRVARKNHISISSIIRTTLLDVYPIQDAEGEQV